MRYCNYCGKAIEKDDAYICPNCFKVIGKRPHYKYETMGTLTKVFTIISVITNAIICLCSLLLTIGAGGIIYAGYGLLILLLIWAATGIGISLATKAIKHINDTKPISLPTKILSIFCVSPLAAVFMFLYNPDKKIGNKSNM